MAGTIVVGVTDRAVSERVVDWAAARAGSTGDRLVLLSVVGGAVGAVGEAEVLGTAVTAAESLAETHAERLRSQGGEVEVRVVHGNPTAQLIESSTDASLLVIGSDYRGEGHGGRRGPHGRRIVAGSHCPVVVVPDYDVGGRSGVVVGLDGSDLSRRALEFAADEASRTGETLTAVSAWTPMPVGSYGMGEVAYYPELYLTDLQGVTESMVADLLAPVREAHPQLRIEAYVAEGDPGLVVNDAAVSARLAVVGTHGRGGLARLLLGSVSENVLAELATVTAVVR
ncbi:universal stress protein [Microbacterium sp. BWT-B31]|uniref:universal stress protein n=1 Tax=Microbacterium sp. BWT-B31 TaxID=3232072 RepID=UPI003527689F